MDGFTGFNPPQLKRSATRSRSWTRSTSSVSPSGGACGCGENTAGGWGNHGSLAELVFLCWTVGELSMRRSRVVALTTAAALAAASGPAWASSRGPAYFTFAHQPSGASSAPSVAVLPDGAAVVAWIDFATDGNGRVDTCRIAVGAAKCAAAPEDLGEAGSTTVPIRGGSGANPVALAGADGEVVILAGGQNTYAFVSHDGGRTFAAPVAISEALEVSSGRARRWWLCRADWWRRRG